MLLGSLLAIPVNAQNLPVDPEFEALKKDIEIAPQANSQLPLERRFLDENGQEVALGQYFDGQRPVILTFVYFRCPGICNDLLDAQVEVLRNLAWTPGEKFQVLTISIDPRDDPQAAAARKGIVLEKYGRPEAGQAWHFLTGQEADLRRVAKASGFGYQWVEKRGEYAHGAALFILSPEGRLSRYLENLWFEPETVRLALIEASEGKVGSVWDRITLLCLNFDPEIGKYVPMARRVMFIGCSLVMLVVATLIILLRRAEIKAAARTTHVAVQGAEDGIENVAGSGAKKDLAGTQRG